MIADWQHGKRRNKSLCQILIDRLQAGFTRTNHAGVRRQNINISCTTADRILVEIFINNCEALYIWLLTANKRKRSESCSILHLSGAIFFQISAQSIAVTRQITRAHLARVARPWSATSSKEKPSKNCKKPGCFCSLARASIYISMRPKTKPKLRHIDTRRFLIEVLLLER